MPRLQRHIVAKPTGVVLSTETVSRTAHAHQTFAALRDVVVALIRLWRGPQVTAAREYYASNSLQFILESTLVNRWRVRRVLTPGNHLGNEVAEGCACR